MSEIGWPQAHPWPAVAGGRGRGGRLPRAPGSTHTRGGRGPARSGPPRASRSLQQRRLQVFIPTVREEPKPPPTKRRFRKDRIFPEINASQTRFQFDPAGNLLHLRVAFLLRRNNAETGVKSGLSKGEVYDTSILQAAGIPFKKCTVAVESRASSTWPPRARLPKANDDPLGQRARPASRAGPGRPPRTRPPPNPDPAPVGLQENKDRGEPARPRRSENAAPQDRQ